MTRNPAGIPGAPAARHAFVSGPPCATHAFAPARRPGAVVARLARTSPSGSGHPSGPMALREGVRPQDPRDRPCDPSPSCPSHARRVPPHLGHAPGSLPGPSGTCARRSPMSLLLSSCARPPRLSRYHARHPRVSLRHVFSLTTSWRRRGASSCRRWSNREIDIDDTLVELLRVRWTNLYGSLDCKRRRDRLP